MNDNIESILEFVEDERADRAKRRDELIKALGKEEELLKRFKEEFGVETIEEAEDLLSEKCKKREELGNRICEIYEKIRYDME